MNISATSHGVTTPRIGLSALARLMGPMRPTTLATMLRGYKYPTPGPRLSYAAARHQAVELLVTGAPLNAGALRGHEREAIAALARMDVTLPSRVVASRPDPSAPLWNVSDVSISMYPDVDLTGQDGGTGAAKFYFTREPLARGVGTLMAALVWHYRANVLRLQHVQPSLCFVCEPRTGATHRPGANPGKQIQAIELTCQLVAAIWPTL